MNPANPDGNQAVHQTENGEVLNHHLSFTAAKTFKPAAASLPETGTSDSPAIYMLALLTSILALFGLKKKEESK